MTRVGRASATIRTAAFLLLSLLVAVPAWAQTAPVPAAAATAPPVKVRSVLILPFATPDASREEAWLGEATAQSITNAFRQVPGLIQVERGRLKALAQPEAWDESAAVAAARALRADVAVFGEVRRTGGDPALQGRRPGVRSDQMGRGPVDPATAPRGAL